MFEEFLNKKQGSLIIIEFQVIVNLEILLTSKHRYQVRKITIKDTYTIMKFTLGGQSKLFPTKFGSLNSNLIISGTYDVIIKHYENSVKLGFHRFNHMICISNDSLSLPESESSHVIFFIVVKN